MKQLIKLVFALGVCVISVSSIAAGNVDAGKDKTTTCVACHGADGVSPNPMFPTLAGQHADYLVYSLKGYKSGERKNPVMQGMAAALSEQDMADIAAFYASQAGLKTLKK